MTISPVNTGLFNQDNTVEPQSLLNLLNELRAALNVPSFRVDRNGSNQLAIVTATITTIQFNNVVFDTHGGWDSAAFQYKALVPGTYLFGVQGRFVTSAVGSATNALFTKNGTIINNVRVLATGVVGPNAVAVGLTTMNGKSDTVNFRCFQDTGVNQNLDGSVENTNAWGFRLAG